MRNIIIESLRGVPVEEQQVELETDDFPGSCSECHWDTCPPILEELE
jgi:hypothetical protein